MKTRPKIYVVIAAYNEETKIAKVLREIQKYCNKIVVVDDGSRDNTGKNVNGRKIVLLTHLVNLGQGAALQTGFEYAKTDGADVVVTYDADGQFKAEEIRKITEPIIKGKAEVVLGSRFLGKALNIPLGRLVVLKFGILFTYIFANIKLTDTHNGFRAFSKEAISKINIVHNRWAHPSDILFQIARNKLKFVEVPVTVFYTQYSKVKGQRNIEAIKIPFALIAKALFN